MALACLIPSNEWDFPFFKRLAHNDTGAASGHQGGIVIPKDLRPFFPSLSENDTSTWKPTTDRRIAAELFAEERFLGTANTRYQFQTWGGERSPESRLTDQLVPLRSLAKAGDLLVIQRSMDRLDLFRLTLVRQSSAEYRQVDALTGEKRWGTFGASKPLTQKDLEAAAADESADEKKSFLLFDEKAHFREAMTKKMARSVVFRERVVRIYERTCAVCKSALKSPVGLYELDAAHIVPRSKLGTDDARNGIALCKRHHWAFDLGLFGISNEMTILVPSHVASIPENDSLRLLQGKGIVSPLAPTLSPHPLALKWHRENIMLSE